MLQHFQHTFSIDIFDWYFSKVVAIGGLLIPNSLLQDIFVFYCPSLRIIYLKVNCIHLFKGILNMNSSKKKLLPTNFIPLFPRFLSFVQSFPSLNFVLFLSTETLAFVHKTKRSNIRLSYMYYIKSNLWLVFGGNN